MNDIFKRLIDILFALIGLIIVFPAMIVISIFIYLESPGNVIFRQKRLGQNGKVFLINKFRKFPARLTDEGPKVTTVDDARMTRVGKILERTKLDELPQLWNILKGEMSFVGPRPETLNNKKLFAADFKSIFQSKPGIFGPNQIAFRNESQLYPAEEEPQSYYERVIFPQKAKNDLIYFVHEANIFNDFIWMLRGVWISIIGTVNWQHFINFIIYSFSIDFFLIVFAWVIANLLRFTAIPVGLDYHIFIYGFWILPPFILFGLLVGGCYRNPVKYFSFIDAIRLFLSLTFSWIMSFLLLMGLTSRNISLFLLIIGWLTILPLLYLPRIIPRLKNELNKVDKNKKLVKCILIYGVNSLGNAVASWMKNDTPGIILLGFLDDNPELREKKIAGVKVLGRESDISTIKAIHHIDEIWMTYLPDKIKLNRLSASCKKLDINLIILPELQPFSRFTQVSHIDNL